MKKEFQMKLPVRFGLIGTGAAARTYYVPAFNKVDEAELVACYDARPERAHDFANDTGCRYYERLKDMLEDGSIDAVVIVTQVQDHAAPVIAACAAGKHVLCEKPMAVSLEEADAMIEAAQGAGVTLAGIFQMRMSNHFAWLRERIAKGGLGCIQSADIMLRQTFSVEHRKARPDVPGSLINILSHDIDFALGLCGPVSEIEFAKVEYWHPDVTPPFEDMALAAWRFESGARGALNMCCSGVKTGQPERSMTITGESGAALLNSMQLTSVSEKDAGGKLSEVDFPAIDSYGHAGHIRDFAMAVVEGRDPVIPGIQHRESLRVLLEIMKLGGGMSLVPLSSDPVRDALGLFHSGKSLTRALLHERAVDWNSEK